MYVNKNKLRELMKEKANGNYHEFARQLGVNVAQLHRTLNTESKAGPRFLGRLMTYCQINNMDFKEYIFLDMPFPACNEVRTGTEGGQA